MIYNQIFHISDLLRKWKNLAKPDTMNGTILVAAANQKPVSLLEKYYVTESIAGSALITKKSQVQSGALRRFTKKLRQQHATLFLIQL